MQTSRGRRWCNGSRMKTTNWRGVRRDTTANISWCARSITHQRNRVLLSNAALTQRQLRNLDCVGENIRAIFCAPLKRRDSDELPHRSTDDTTFGTTAAIRTRSLQTLQVEAVCWC